MITNERQYRITTAEVEKFKKALKRMQTDQVGRSNGHPRLIQAEREGLESQLQELQHELEEYEALKHGNVSRITVDSFDELGIGLIKARIVAGLSQKALAERLGPQRATDSEVRSGTLCFGELSTTTADRACARC